MPRFEYVKKTKESGEIYLEAYATSRDMEGKDVKYFVRDIKVDSRMLENDIKHKEDELAELKAQMGAYTND